MVAGALAGPVPVHPILTAMYYAITWRFPHLVRTKWWYKASFKISGFEGEINSLLAEAIAVHVGICAMTKLWVKGGHTRVVSSG